MSINDAMNGSTALVNHTTPPAPINVTNNTLALDKRVNQYQSACEDADEQRNNVTMRMNNSAYFNGFKGLDFYIAGWPKTGTSTLVNMLSNHPQIVMPREESWYWWRPGNEKKGLSIIERELSRNARNSKLREQQHLRGIKCPGEYRSWAGVQLLSQVYGVRPKVIIGIRHPVLLFQSFYNFRVQNWHTRGWFYHKGEIPRPESLLGQDMNWGDGVNLNHFRFEQYLSLLMKAPPPSGDWRGFGDAPPQRCVPNEVFIYHIDQLGDTDKQRLITFEESLRSFLGLDHPFSPTIKSINVLGQKHPESIDICSSSHNHTRSRLMEVAKESSIWIKNHFLLSTSVTVANRDHFISLLLEFQNDPCI